MIRTNLCALASYYGTDKWNSHWYAQHYQRHFHGIRRQRLKVLEIGVGGYDDPHDGGHSLRMWKAYFPRAMVNGIDIHDKSALEEPRIKIFHGSQADPDFLQWVSKTAGPFDIVIDDGSHVNEHVLSSFEVLFPLLAEGGFYAIEDTQTSYWPGAHGGSLDRSSASTTMGRVKQLVDGLNHAEFAEEGYSPTYFDMSIVAVHCYHNLVIVAKGRNSELSRRWRAAGAALADGTKRQANALAS